MTGSLLILGGTAEARDLANRAVSAWPGMRVISSLAGRTAQPRMPAGEVYRDGFGGAEGLAAYLSDEKIDFLVDATHPFAEEISRNADEAATKAGLPRLVLSRGPWRFAGAEPQAVADLNSARRALGSLNRRVFLAIGRQDVDLFAADDRRFYLLRFVDPPSTPPTFADCQVLTGRPLAQNAEREILTSHKIDTLIAKNGGSLASRAKVDAALALGLHVILIDPPPPPPPPRVETVDAALDWIKDRIDGAA